MKLKISQPILLPVWFFTLFFFNLMAALPQTSLGEEGTPYSPTRYGLGVTLGNTYAPTADIGFGMITGFVMYDYDQIWPHKAPEALRFKIEGSMGTTFKPEAEFMASLGIMALYYLDSLSARDFRPYAEAGVGVIYTGFKVEGQGLNVNFNPQIGIGAEFSLGASSTYFTSLRLHHLSNAGLNKDNRGVNSIVFLLGCLF